MNNKDKLILMYDYLTHKNITERSIDIVDTELRKNYKYHLPYNCSYKENYIYHIRQVLHYEFNIDVEKNKTLIIN